MDNKQKGLRNYKLKALRQKKGITQPEMAKRMGKGLATYQRKERGETEFTESEMLDAANILEVEVMDIFFKEEYKI